MHAWIHVGVCLDVYVCDECMCACVFSCGDVWKVMLLCCGYELDLFF